MATLVRTLVSKKKRRFLEDGFDLDLTYITPRIIAMGFPGENMEGIYRNNMSEVIRFLDTRHFDHYKVYNLCSEKSYDKSRFYGRVSCYPFEDHNAPPIELMQPFCQDVNEYLKSDEHNVAVVHCKAGKGRTGVMICAYLVHCGDWPDARQALEFYAACRTKNSKGVTIPSQLRYVLYYEIMLCKKMVYEPKTILLTAVAFSHLPRITKEGGCNLFFTVKKNAVKTLTSPVLYHRSPCAERIVIELKNPHPICGDVKMEFFHKSMTKEKICHFWFNTAFYDGNSCTFQKEDIDKAIKDKQHKLFNSTFSITLLFHGAHDVGERGGEIGVYPPKHLPPALPPTPAPSTLLAKTSPQSPNTDNMIELVSHVSSSTSSKTPPSESVQLHSNLITSAVVKPVSASSGLILSTTKSEPDLCNIASALCINKATVSGTPVASDSTLSLHKINSTKNTAAGSANFSRASSNLSADEDDEDVFDDDGFDEEQ